MSAQTDLIKTIIHSLSQERFSEAVAIFERSYLGNEVVSVDGHGDGGCDIKRFKDGKELLECIQVTVNKSNLKTKLYDDLAKVKRLITQFGYSPSFDFYCSEVLADDKINEYREYAKKEHGVELQIYDANRLSGLECPKLQDYLFNLLELGPSSFPLVDLNDYLSMRLAWTRKHHPSFRLMEIDDSLFPDGIEKYYNITALNDANETKTIAEIVADSWGREKNHLMIEGEGGIGKTVTLLSFPDKFVPHKVPAVYVQLYKLKGVREDETIEEYIKAEYFRSKDTLFKQFQELTEEPWKDGPQVLLLLDGFNEIAPSRRYIIGEDINRWANRPGIQIITSSRFDIHSYLPLGEGYSRILLQQLSRETVADYLDKAKIKHPTTESQWKVISFPLMLTLYAQTQAVMVSIDRDNNLQDFRESNNAGTIIWNYLQREIWRFRMNDSDVVKCIIAAEYIAPYIAWQMQKESKFILEEQVFEDYLDQAYEIVSKLDKKQLPPHIRRVLRRKKAVFNDDYIIDIQLFLDEELRLFVKNGKFYSLMHQQFRDALAALHLINISYSSTELPKEWKELVDYYVMQFVVDYASQDEADTLWELNRTSEGHNDASTINMLELQKQKRDYDFSSLNFSGLDLRNMSLYHFRIPDSSTLRVPRDGYLNEGLQISNKTFYPDGHLDSISAVFFTPDGKKFISGSRDKTLRVWDLESGLCLWTLEGHHGYIRTLAVTPDGKRCVSGSEDKTLRVWDLESGQCLWTLEGHRNSVTTLAITPDGKRCISGSEDCTLRIWDLESGHSLWYLGEHDAPVTTLAITPDGKRCVSGSWDKTLRVLDLESGQCMMLNRHSRSIEAIAITSDGKRCVSGSEDKTLRVWDLESGQCLWTLEGHDGGIRTLAITPDGRRCVSGAYDTSPRIWDLESGQCMRTLEGHDGSIGIISISSDGKRCVSGSEDCSLRVWDLESGQCMRILEGHKHSITTLAITPDSRRCVSGSNDNSLQIWDLESGQCLRTLDRHKYNITALAITSDGKRCISGGGLLDSTLRVWDLESDQCLRILEGHDNSISTIALTKDGKRCVSAAKDKTLRIWDLESGQCLNTLRENEYEIRTFAITSDGKRCASATFWSHTLRVWDLETGQSLRMPEKHYLSIRTLAITPDGKRCVSGGDDRTLRVWDLESGQCLRTLKEHSGDIYTLAITPDGKRCVSGSNDYTLRVWDLESGQCLNTFQGHSRSIEAIAITSDGKRCVSGSDDYTLRVWDLESGQCLRILEGHKHYITTLAITQDDRRCVSGSRDKTLRVWDLESGQCLRILEGHDDGLITFAVAPDGRRCIAAGSRERFYEWNLETFQEKTITILPLFLDGADFSESIITPPYLKETLQQNGAIV